MSPEMIAMFVWSACGIALALTNVFFAHLSLKYRNSALFYAKIANTYSDACSDTLELVQTEASVSGCCLAEMKALVAKAELMVENNGSEETEEKHSDEADGKAASEAGKEGGEESCTACAEGVASVIDEPDDTTAEQDTVTANAAANVIDAKATVVAETVVQAGGDEDKPA